MPASWISAWASASSSGTGLPGPATGTFEAPAGMCTWWWRRFWSPKAEGRAEPCRGC